MIHHILLQNPLITVVQEFAFLHLVNCNILLSHSLLTKSRDRQRLRVGYHTLQRFFETSASAHARAKLSLAAVPG